MACPFLKITTQLLLLIIITVLMACETIQTDSPRTCHEDFVKNGLILKSSIDKKNPPLIFINQDFEDCPNISKLTGKELYKFAFLVLGFTDTAIGFGNFNSINDLVNFYRYYLIQSARTGYEPAVLSLQLMLENKDEKLSMPELERMDILSCLHNIKLTIDHPAGYLHIYSYTAPEEVNKCMPKYFEEKARFF